jgi:SAM-dependent methyltransferase
MRTIVSRSWAWQLPKKHTFVIHVLPPRAGRLPHGPARAMRSPSPSAVSAPARAVNPPRDDRRDYDLAAARAIGPGRAGRRALLRACRERPTRIREMVDIIGKEYVGQHTAFRSLSRFCRIEGKHVLEVGGNSNCVAATPFATAGAAEVIVTGLEHVEDGQQPPHPGIRLERADALALRDKFPEGRFDLVYGISVLEHIPAPRKFFSELELILSRGGMAFLQGAPTWNGPLGHHIWLSPWANQTIGCYQFLPSEVLIAQGVKVVNPIPDWGHLLYTADELADVLKRSDIPEPDVERIVHFTFSGDVINREPTSSICRGIRDSGLEVVELEYDRVAIPGDVLAKLRTRYSDRDDFSILGMRVLLRKV